MIGFLLNYNDDDPATTDKNETGQTMSAAPAQAIERIVMQEETGSLAGIYDGEVISDAHITFFGSNGNVIKGFQGRG